MPRVKLFKYLMCLGILGCQPAWLHAQPVIGQMIEQAKRSKWMELAPLTEAPVPGRMSATAPVDDGTTPELWSLNGLNRLITAELLFGEQIHQVLIKPGARIPGGWTIVQGGAESLTIRKGKKKVTLHPVALGSAGNQFSALRVGSKSDPNSLFGIQDSLNSRGFPSEFMSTDPTRPAPGTVNARQAAGGLPSRP
jgi:hypothetical protein